MAVQAEEVERRVRRGCARRRLGGVRRARTPNFWSSCAVARNSWVSACTPLLTRRRTALHARRRALRRSRRAARSRSRCRSRSSRRRPSTARSISATRLVVAVESEPRGIRARGERDGELAAACRRRRARPSSVTQRTTSRRRGTPCRRSTRAPARRADGPRRPRNAPRRVARVPADVVLVDDVEGRAEALARARSAGTPPTRRTPCVVAVAPARATPAAARAFASAGTRSHAGAGAVDATGNLTGRWTRLITRTASEPGSVPEASVQ